MPHSQSCSLKLLESFLFSWVDLFGILSVDDILTAYWPTRFTVSRDSAAQGQRKGAGSMAVLYDEVGTKLYSFTLSCCTVLTIRFYWPTIIYVLPSLSPINNYDAYDAGGNNWQSSHPTPIRSIVCIVSVELY